MTASASHGRGLRGSCAEEHTHMSEHTYPVNVPTKGSVGVHI